MHCLHCVSEAVDIIKRINTSAVCVIKIERKMKKKKKMTGDGITFVYSPRPHRGAHRNCTHALHTQTLETR